MQHPHRAVVVEVDEGEHRLALLVHHHEAPVAQVGDEAQEPGLELRLAAHRGEIGVGGVAIGLGGLQVGGLLGVLQPVAVRVEERIVALGIVPLHAREVLVGGGDQHLARHPLGGRDRLQPRRLRLAQRLVAGRTARIADDLALHFGDAAVLDLQPHVEYGGYAALGDGGDHRRRPRLRVGEDVAIAAQPVDGAPAPLAQRQELVVLAEADRGAQRQARGVVAGQGGQVLADEALQAGPVAGLGPGRGRKRPGRRHQGADRRRPAPHCISPSFAARVKHSAAPKKNLGTAAPGEASP